MAIDQRIPNKSYIKMLRKYKCLTCKHCTHECCYLAKENSLDYANCNRHGSLIEMSDSDIFMAFGGCIEYEELRIPDMHFGYERVMRDGVVILNKEVNVFNVPKECK